MSFIEIEKSVRTEEWSMNDLHSHSHYEIYYLTKGSRTFFLSNALYRLTAPILIVIPPHVMHKTEGGAFERFNVNADDGYLDEFQRQVFSERALKMIALTPEEHTTLLALFEKLRSIDRRQKFSEQILRSLFSYAVLCISELRQSTLPPQAEKQGNTPPVVLKIIDFLNTHYAEHLTLDSIAAQFFLSKSALIYNFKKHTGCSPIDFLLNVRITKAKQLLAKTRMSIGDIAAECGFSSANYFGLIFKQKEQLSPVAYRKLQTSKR